MRPTQKSLKSEIEYKLVNITLSLSLQSCICVCPLCRWWPHGERSPERQTKSFSLVNLADSTIDLKFGPISLLRDLMHTIVFKWGTEPTHGGLHIQFTDTLTQTHTHTDSVSLQPGRRDKEDLKLANNRELLIGALSLFTQNTRTCACSETLGLTSETIFNLLSHYQSSE